MKALNIYFLSQMDDEEYFSQYETALSGGKELHTVKTHEQASLRALVRALSAYDLPPECYDGFFFSFVISHISKEFDLLKIADDHSKILNIELKSQYIEEERIAKQLLQNRYYLRHISGKIFSYTYILSSGTLCRLGDDEKLHGCSFTELCEDIKGFSGYVERDIDALFRADDFLISPCNTPDKFLSHSYFLTTQQNDFKAQIVTLAGTELWENEDAVNAAGLAAIPASAEPEGRNGVFISITGSPGTGKTLLLYDLACDLSAGTLAAIIHCGPISDSHRYLDSKMDRTDIFSSSDIARLLTAGGKRYSLILVDESQRLERKEFEIIRNYVRAAGAACIFSFDSRQILYAPDESLQIVKDIQDISAKVLRLSGRIRTSKELSSFIITLFSQKRRTNIYDYGCVQVIYARSVSETLSFVRYYLDRGFDYISYDSMYDLPTRESADRPSGGSHVYSAYQVIGQEFDAVLMVMDRRFYYDDNGDLNACQKSGDPFLYREMLFQGISRAREKLTVIVCGDPELFARINSIKLPPQTD